MKFIYRGKIINANAINGFTQFGNGGLIAPSNSPWV